MYDNGQSCLNKQVRGHPFFLVLGIESVSLSVLYDYCQCHFAIVRSSLSSS